MIRTTIVHRQNRKSVSPAQPPAPSFATILTAVAMGAGVVLTFDQAVLVKGLPFFTVTNVGPPGATVVPTAIISHEGAELQIFLSGVVVAGDALVWAESFQEVIRTRSGGYVDPQGLALT